MQSQNWAAVSFTVVLDLDVFRRSNIVAFTLFRPNGPVDVAQLSLIRGSPEGWSVLTLLEENFREAHFTRTVEPLNGDGDGWHPWHQLVLGNLSVDLLQVDLPGVPNVEDTVFSACDEEDLLAVVHLLSGLDAKLTGGLGLADVLASINRVGVTLSAPATAIASRDASDGPEHGEEAPSINSCSY